MKRPKNDETDMKTTHDGIHFSYDNFVTGLRLFLIPTENDIDLLIDTCYKINGHRDVKNISQSI